MSEYDLARKYAWQGAYVKKVKMAGSWVSKCFLVKCPRCSKKLPGMLTADGIECCVTPKCDDRRQVYTPTELKHLACWVRFSGVGLQVFALTSLLSPLFPVSIGRFKPSPFRDFQHERHFTHTSAMLVFKMCVLDSAIAFNNEWVGVCDPCTNCFFDTNCILNQTY